MTVDGFQSARVRNELPRRSQMTKKNFGAQEVSNKAEKEGGLFKSFLEKLGCVRRTEM